MNNKVLIKLFVPEISLSFDIFIPVNEVVWKIKKLLAKSIYDLTSGTFDLNADYTLISKATSFPYDNNLIVINTDIRNATELIFIKSKQEEETKENILL